MYAFQRTFLWNYSGLFVDLSSNVISFMPAVTLMLVLVSPLEHVKQRQSCLSQLTKFLTRKMLNIFFCKLLRCPVVVVHISITNGNIVTLTANHIKLFTDMYNLIIHHAVLCVKS